MKIRASFVSNSSSSSFIISLNTLSPEQLVSVLTDPDIAAPLGIEIILDILNSKLTLETDNHVDYWMYDYLKQLGISNYNISAY